MKTMRITPKSNVQDVADYIFIQSEENDHTGAILSLAKFSGDKLAIDMATSAKKLHMKIGYCSEEVRLQRTAAKSMAENAIITTKGFEVFRKLKESF